MQLALKLLVPLVSMTIQLTPLIPVVDHRGDPLKGSATYIKGDTIRRHRSTRLNAHSRRFRYPLRVAQSSPEVKLSRALTARLARQSVPFDLKAVAKMCRCGDEGSKFIKKHKWRLAANYYRHHLNDRKDAESRAEIHNELAWSLAHTRHLDESIQYATKSINLKKEYQAVGTRGYAYLRKGEYGKAIADLKDALKLNPDDFEDHYYLALAYLKSGKPHDAEKELNIATQGGYVDKSNDWKIAL